MLNLSQDKVEALRSEWLSAQWDDGFKIKSLCFDISLLVWILGPVIGTCVTLAKWQYVLLCFYICKTGLPNRLLWN